jgi:outer membrane lipoprotein-sorting protein
MRSLRAIGVGMLVLLLVWAGGCSGGSGTPEEQAKADTENLQRPRQLLPDVEPLPPTGALGQAGAPATPGAPGAPGTGTGAPAAPAPVVALPAELQQAAQELTAKSPTIRTVAFEIRGSRAKDAAATPGGGPEPPLNGRVEAAPPDRIRIEGTGEMEGQEVKMLTVMNGPKMWLEIRDAATNEPKQVIKMDLAAMPGAEVTNEGPMAAATPTAGAFLGNLGRQVAFDTVRDESLDGEPCKVFEGKERNPEAGAQPKTTRVWFSTKDGMVRRIQEADAAGQTLTDLRISNIEANPPIPMSRFEYAPPAGVPVIDMAEMFKQMMEGMGKTMQEGLQKMGEQTGKTVEQGLQTPAPDEEAGPPTENPDPLLPPSTPTGDIN